MEPKNGPASSPDMASVVPIAPASQVLSPSTGPNPFSELSIPAANPSHTAPLDSGNFEISYDVKTLYRPPIKKSPKKQKPHVVLPDLGNNSVPSPVSSITSSVIPSARPRPQFASGLLRSFPNAAHFAKPKDKSLIYVNYLNAFANSLTVHPPIRRVGLKNNPGNPGSKSSADEDGTVSRQCIDFESNTKLGLTTPFIPDFDRDRCGHTESFCPFSKREGYPYCEKHLLDDKGLPFVPCAFQRTESNPCPYPARMPPGAGGKNRPQRSKEALCALHIEKCMQEVQNHMRSSANAVLSTMDGLAAYNINSDKGLPPTNCTDMLDDLAEPQSRDNLETYLRATAKDTYATDATSEESALEEKDVTLFASKAFDTDDELDSEVEEPLKYCHKYSVEELARQLRSKLSKQKELLLLEVRLQEYRLKDARARYLTEVAEEKTFLPSVSTQARKDPESHRAYRALRTMMRVNRRRPKFSFMHTRKPCVKLRHGGKLPESVSRCLHSDPLPNGKSVKCKMYSLPFSRHCLTHILEDNYQYLYKRCASEQQEQCGNPVLRSMGVRYCYLHADLNKLKIGSNLDDSFSVSSSTVSEAEVDVVPPVEPDTSHHKKSKRPRSSRDAQKSKVVELEPAGDEEELRVDDIFAKLEQQENLHQIPDSDSNPNRQSGMGGSNSILDISMSL